ncbi:hypothetical protein [Gracilibacillus timonensis]|uniref:hypothetical protein n=1 Tax=Gracilibacillus timonensis TaxID=1816696 RepID=UPI00082544C7|nr:hypothetical protein [Gracilibacillus timonensis]
MGYTSSFPSLSSSNRTQKTTAQPPMRPGQLLTGKVLEIYPQQRAAIQLGGTRIVARIETALTAKQNYLFQVTAVDQMVHLKKVSEVPANTQGKLSNPLLQQIGLSSNSPAKPLFQQLIQQQIPFTSKQLRQITDLLEQKGNSTANRELLLQMVKQQLPLTEATFQSLQSFQSNSLARQIQQVLQQIGSQTGQPSLAQALTQQLMIYQSEIGEQANARLQQFLASNSLLLSLMVRRLAPTQESVLAQLTAGKPVSEQQIRPFVDQLQNLLNQQLPAEKQQSLAHMVSRLRHDPDATATMKQAFANQGFFSEVLRRIPTEERQLLQRILQTSSANFNQQAASLLQRLSQNQLSAGDQQILRTFLLQMDQAYPTSLSATKDTMINLLKHFVQSSGLQDESQIAQSLQQAGSGALSSRSILVSTGLLQQGDPSQRFGQVLQHLQQSLPADQQRFFVEWLLQSPAPSRQNEQMATMIRGIETSSLTPNQQTMVQELKMAAQANSGFTKETMLQVIRPFLQQTSLQETAYREQDLSVKQQLMLLQQQQPDVAGNQVQRLVQSLTGLQIHMTHDPAQGLLQIPMYIPGDRLGLAGDIKLQFEGKKRKGSDEIDPDFCKILFHLQLRSLGETMIAMSVQKRMVHLTVYNDEERIKPLMEQFKPLLKDKLEMIDYRLTTVTHKPISQTVPAQPARTERQTYPNEGVDYRI